MSYNRTPGEAVTAHRSEERAAFYERLDSLDMAPLWESLHALVPRVPDTPVRVGHWNYDDVVRPRLMEAGALITAREAERRVLVLENPGMRGQSSITTTLYAGFQLVLPGEVAPAHRHAQSALRFIIEGRDAYTAVAGERTAMRPGDLVLTPGWTWHDHGNDTDAPMVWLDGLDIPLVRSLAAGFQESAAAESQEVRRPIGDSFARYGQNMLPVDWKPEGGNSPVFNYPYERSREALAALARNGAPDPCHGHKLRYVNPATGGPPMPTIGAFLQLLPARFASAPYRSTDATIFVVVEGSGESRIGETLVKWKPRDVFVAPGWEWQRHVAAGEAVLFSFSDRPVQSALGLWREDRGGE